MTKLFNVLMILAALSAPDAFAAKYMTVAKASNPSVQKLVANLAQTLRDKKRFGDVSFVRTFSFDRSQSQTDLNVVKQLNHMYAGLNSDDSAGKSFENKSAGQLTDSLFENSTDNDASVIDGAKYEFRELVLAVKNDRALQIYGTNHSDEDGTWQILNILDTENDQVVLIRMGFSGT